MTLNGIDVSNWQQGIDLSRLPKLDLAIFKASQGTGYPDAHFDGFMRQAINLGIPRTGGYWWVETHQDVRPQLDVFLRKVEPFLNHPGFRLWVDWEPRNPERVDHCAEAVRQLKDRTGAQPHVYMNRSTAHTHRWQPVRDLGCHLWLAQYASSNRVNGFQSDPWHQKPAGWEDRVAGLQYTDKGRLNGYSGDLDLNRFWYWPGEDTKTGGGSQVTVPAIPTIREADPPVHLFHHHGGQLFTSRGAPRLGCVCMKLTFPLIEREMIRRGLIRHQIDVFQAGYSKGVAASAGTHDMGGVIDVAQGITLEQRRVWAEFGVMMFPRTREFGWTTGDHGHGVWHGCVHRTASAAKQVRDGMNGLDGLVSNRRRNFEAPTRTWQDAYRQHAAQTITIASQEDEVPDFVSYATEFDHKGVKNADDPDTGWELPPKDEGVVVGPRGRRLKIDANAVIHVPEGVTLRTRWVSWSGRDEHGWVRGPARQHESHQAETVWKAEQAWPGADLRLDVWCDKPCRVSVQAAAWVWELD